MEAVKLHVEQIIGTVDVETLILYHLMFNSNRGRYAGFGMLALGNIISSSDSVKLVTDYLELCNVGCYNNYVMYEYEPGVWGKYEIFFASDKFVTITSLQQVLLYCDGVKTNKLVDFNLPPMVSDMYRLAKNTMTMIMSQQSLLESTQEHQYQISVTGKASLGASIVTVTTSDVGIKYWLETESEPGSELELELQSDMLSSMFGDVIIPEYFDCVLVLFIGVYNTTYKIGPNRSSWNSKYIDYSFWMWDDKHYKKYVSSIQFPVVPQPY